MLPVGVVGAALVLTAGCIDYLAEDYAPLTDPKLATWDAGADADSGPAPSCIPSNNVEAVADACGVFVSSSKGSDTTGKGSKAAPYQTLAKALAKAGGQPVYACGEGFDEAVTISTSVELYGALECAKGWAYSAATKTRLTASADAIPMKLASSADGSAVHDFAITAADAMAAGGSSIAVLDEGAALTLENVDVVAGKGAAGAAGSAQAQVMTQASAKGSDGGDDAMCNVASNIPGGAGGTNACSATKTDGGNGGKGIPDVNGGQGGDGQPISAKNGGAGQTSMASCKAGTQGTDGLPGTAGTGAKGIGDVSTSGYHAPAGALGGTGNPGQGGGGGGGARECDMAAMFAGPSGGGGGAGGCGGLAGDPGHSGGSSIGILAPGAKLTLTTVMITTKGGGAGGLGGNGQKGAAGGLEGHAVAVGACSGGPGGQGGAGGPGGGGAGGHSVAVAIKGGTLPDLKSTTVKHGSGGTGGGGGDMDVTMQTRGDDGLGCKTLDFTNPASPKACAM